MSVGELLITRRISARGRLLLQGSVRSVFLPCSSVSRRAFTDGDDRLVREGGHEVDLLLGEGAHDGPVHENEFADRSSPAAAVGDGQHGSLAADLWASCN
jgi:hypothetical protein